MSKLIRISTAIIALSISLGARAELMIFDVRKNLPMSDADKVYRDFYINGGSEAGITNGMVITVQRRLPLYDTYSNRSAGDLELKVAKVKIIHVQKGLSVARLHTEYARDNSPLLEDNFIMVGDRLDLATAVVDKVDKPASSAANDREDHERKPSPKPEPMAAAIIPKGDIVVSTVGELSPNPEPASGAAPAPQPPAEQKKVDVPAQ
jgi:hypothetical protein